MIPIEAKCPICGKTRQIGATNDEFKPKPPVYDLPCEEHIKQWEKNIRASKLISNLKQ
ncbi:MAG: hypothetical protein WC479_07240 [Candidatus Izemoplasmatales bacterium]